jgi:hypothetical protein
MPANRNLAVKHYGLLAAVQLTIVAMPVLLANFQSAWAQETSTASGQPQKPSVSADVVRKLLRELDADELAKRDTAEKQLVELGAGIVQYLPVIDANTSGEMKIRLQRIRQQLQQVDAVEYFDVSKVTLSGKMKVKQALAEILKQTGNEVEIESNGESEFEDVEIELDFKDSPFWTVLDAILEQSKLRINAYSSSQALALTPGESDYAEAPKAVTSGPFRINMVSAQSTLPFASRLGGQLDLSLLVSWEPRLKPVYMQIPMASMQATTDTEKTLAAPNPQAYPEIPLNAGGCNAQIDVQLARPDRDAKRLTKLSGEFAIAVPGEKHKFIFKKFGNGARQSEKFQEVSVTLEGARKNGAVFEMRVLVEFGNAAGALDSFRGWVLSNEAYLLDPKQRRLENVGLQTYSVTSDSVGIAYLFQINGNPDEFQLVYESPAAMSKQTVKYQLENIDLP